MRACLCRRCMACSAAGSLNGTWLLVPGRAAWPGGRGGSAHLGCQCRFNDSAGASACRRGAHAGRCACRRLAGLPPIRLLMTLGAIPRGLSTSAPGLDNRQKPLSGRHHRGPRWLHALSSRPSWRASWCPRNPVPRSPRSRRILHLKRLGRCGSPPSAFYPVIYQHATRSLTHWAGSSATGSGHPTTGSPSLRATVHIAAINSVSPSPPPPPYETRSSQVTDRTTC